MTKEEAKLKLNRAQSTLNLAERDYKNTENYIAELTENIEKLEAIISEKDNWREKPLFTTEDGVEIYINNVKLFAVNSTFITASDNNFDFEVCKKEGWKLFFHKFNADKYILWNKPLLSLQEIDATIEVYLHEFDELKKLAEERLNHER